MRRPACRRKEIPTTVIREFNLGSNEVFSVLTISHKTGWQTKILLQRKELVTVVFFFFLILCRIKFNYENGREHVL